MGFKEVNALRKEGKLQEALEMARGDYASRQDQWSAAALYWCLNELYKTIDEPEEKRAIVEQMHEVIGHMRRDEEDDIAGRALAAADRALRPHHDEIMAASQQSKEGDAVAAYRAVMEFYDEVASEDRETVGWIVYRSLHAGKELPSLERRRMLNNYLRLELPAPSILHSRILAEAMATERAEKENFKFTRFVELWGLENLRDEDWQEGKTQDGNRYPSLVERMITLYTAEVKDEPEVTPSEAFMTVLDRAIKRWPSNDNALRGKALCLLRLGQHDEALAVYKRLVLMLPSKTYLWGELAALVADPQQRISLLCKGLDVKAPDQLKGKMRLALIDALVAQQQWPWALAELNKHREIYERNGWNLSNTFKSLARRIPSGTVPAQQRYSDHTAAADAFIYSELPSVVMVKTGDFTDTVTDRNTGRPKKVNKWVLTAQDGTQQRIKPRQMGLASMPVGQCFEARIGDGKIRHIRPIDTPSCDWLKTVTGPLKPRTNSKGQPFAFLGDCYVGDRLLNALGPTPPGTPVTALAILKDGKWRCITLARVE